ncbi:MAG: acyltransferase [Chitinophagaceae bacterium]|nr:acyltransferase [Chitinophagaceae bacterium]
MQTANLKRFDALTGARWLFASLVFVYHNRKYWRNDVNKYVLQLMNELHIGVSLFFVLSGFLIAYKYNADKNKPFHYGRYAGLRMARILPLYWLLLLVSYTDWGWPKTYQAIITFTLAHGFSNIHNLDGIAQAWSLTVELTFYIIAPLLFILWNKHVLKALLFLLLLLAVVTAIGFAWHKLNGNKDQYFYPFYFVQHSTFFGRFPEFVAGIWLAGILHRHHKDPFKKVKHKTYTGFAGIFISLFIISFLQPDIFHHGNDTIVGAALQYTLIPLFAIVWMYGLVKETTRMSRFFAWKPVVLLGNASFAFYLVHISYVNLRVQRWKLFTDRNYVLLWLISIALYLLFEKPVNDLFRKLLHRKKLAQLPCSP